LTPAKVVSCRQFAERVDDYLEGALSPPERAAAVAHLADCPGCRGFLAQTETTVAALGRLPSEPVSEKSKRRALELFRLHRAAQARPGDKGVPLGIGAARATAGDHAAYFWETEAEFDAAADFLGVGLLGRDHAFVFGYDEANQKVLAALRRRGFDVVELEQQGRLTVLAGSASGEAMLTNLGRLFQGSLDAGAPMIRLLGNLGWGRANWPDEDGILRFEARVTDAARQFPCLILCMYDVRSLSGRVMLRGGIETHPKTMCGDQLQENPHYVPTESFLARLGSNENHSRRH
jgi:hypothetical protein